LILIKIDINKSAIAKIEQDGIVFIDEIDKIATPEVLESLIILMTRMQ
jgi:ATP-dependent protease HslVU (ClpYQ) ATPase subunit